MFTYTAISGSTSVLRSDGVTVPAQPSMSDWQNYQDWLKNGNTLAPAPVPPFDPSAVDAECARRIFAVASANTQVNIIGYIATGTATTADKAAFNDSVAWIAAMRAACTTLKANSTTTYALDSNWPTCPADVAALAAKF